MIIDFDTYRLRHRPPAAIRLDRRLVEDQHFLARLREQLAVDRTDAMGMHPMAALADAFMHALGDHLALRIVKILPILSHRDVNIFCDVISGIPGREGRPAEARDFEAAGIDADALTILIANTDLGSFVNYEDVLVFAGALAAPAAA